MPLVMNNRNPTNRRYFIAAVFAIALLVALAFFGRSASRQQPVNDTEASELAEQSELNTRLMQDNISERLAGGPLNAEQERLDSPRGQALMSKCLEWTEFHSNHPSDATLLNKTAACKQYRDFIATGVEPD
jgi:hypothetical protein